MLRVPAESIELYKTTEPWSQFGSIVAIEEQEVEIDIASGQWQFLCLPFDVQRSEIWHENSSTQFAVRYYDGASRAENGKGDNWKNVAQDGVIPAGTGFILHHNGAGVERFAFTSCGNEIDTDGSITLPLHGYAGDNKRDNDWNFIGNPYQQEYNMAYTDFTAPITVWNGEGYDAYRPQDDKVVLQPYQACFVQKQEMDAVTFQDPFNLLARSEAPSRKWEGWGDDTCSSHLHPFRYAYQQAASWLLHSRRP